MAVDDGYARLQEAERLLRELRAHVHKAVRIRLAKIDLGREDQAEIEALLAALVGHYPDIDQSTDKLAEMLREIGEQLKIEDD